MHVHDGGNRPATALLPQFDDLLVEVHSG